MNQGKIHTEFRACNLCEAICGLAIEVEGDRVLAIRGDPEDPFSRGHICPKAVALQDIRTDPDRLKAPLRRTSGGWEPLAWDDAFGEVASRLRRIQRDHGPNAVGMYQGNPTVHNSGTMLFAPPFSRALRTRNRFSATSVDQLPHHLAAHAMFGHQLLLPIPDVDRTDFFLILGANPLASNGSLMTAPGIGKRLQALRARGGRLVVVDPRRTETAMVADTHHFIRPGRDAALLLALLHTLFAEERIAPGRLASCTDGIKTLARLVADFPPVWAARITGIDADAIECLAREFAAAPSAVCYGRVGASTQAFGSACQWLIQTLNLVTGNLDRAGGAMFTTPAIDLLAGASGRARTGHLARWSSRVRGAPEFGGELPVAVLAEEILTEGEGQIRALITSAGNPVLSTPNGRQLERALERLEFMVSIDIYVNETTRHADIILPPATGLETDHYDLAFHLLAVRNTARYSRALFPPEAGARHDWQIFRELRSRLEDAGGRRVSLRRRAARVLERRLTPERMLDLGLRLGPYGVWGGRRLRRDGLSLQRLRRSPHGIDLGPLEPRLPERLFTVDQRIQLTPDVFVAEIWRIRDHGFAPQPAGGPDGSAAAQRLAASGRSAAQPTLTTPGDAAAPDFDLSLIGRRQLRSNNSWMHNSERLVRGRERCTLLIHPKDAEARQLRDGQRAEVASRVGRIEIVAEVSDEVMPGVVSIPHGWGHDRPGVLLPTASAHAGASINDLTDDHLTDALSGNAAFSGVPVRVTKVEAGSTVRPAG